MKLTCQSALTFKADGTYSYNLNTKNGKADQMVASGVAILPGARFEFTVPGEQAIAEGPGFHRHQ